MELPTCPHCGQSVLDDDVEECPFCGELMSGPPTGKKPPQSKPSPAPKETAATQAEAKPATKRPAKTKPRSAEASHNPDQPFAVDQAAMANAVPLRPKPSPGRAFKVVCPMCETAGYTSPKAGGREVKCPNPKCLVPVFTCPEPPPAPVEEAPPEPSGLSTTQFGLISAAALIAIGVGIWFFVLKGNSSPTPPPDLGGGIASDSDAIDQNTLPEQTGDAEPETAPVAPKGPDLVKLREEALEKMVETSQLPSGRGISRPRPLRVQWIALAYAGLGELNKAEQQLNRLSSFNDDEPHYRVLPWVEIGWKLREREEPAKPVADKAVEAAKNEPASSHDSWLQAVSLSALLTATGRIDETTPLMKRNFGRAEDQELWSDMVTVGLDGTFNLDALEPVRPVVTPINPAWSGVVWQLVFHDAANEGLTWAKRAGDPHTRGEALIAWADAVVTRGLTEQSEQPAQLTELEAAIDELPAPWPAVVKARAYARMGQRQAIAGEGAQAKTMLQTAQQALASLPKPDALSLPDLKDIHAGNFPRGEASHHLAAAAFEVARLQSRLNQSEEAWESIEHGLAALRSESLPLNATEQLLAEIKTGADFLRGSLRNALSLNTEDEARQAFRNYQKHVNELHARSEARLKLQADLLSQAAQWNLGEQVSQELLRLSEAEGGDSYFGTELPWVVLAELREQNPDLAKSLDAKLKEKRLSKPKGQALLEASARHMKDLDIPKVVESLGRPTPALPNSVRKRWILRLCTQQVLEGQTGDVLSLLLGLFNVDPFLGEDAAELIAGLATRNGQGEILWNELEQRSWSPTQKVAAYRGFVAAANLQIPKEDE